jgi:hypothetical protein
LQARVLAQPNPSYFAFFDERIEKGLVTALAFAKPAFIARSASR